MDEKTFCALLTPAGQAALQAAAALQPREVDFLAHYSLLARQVPPELARAALETAILRLEAAVKFPFANQMYFTRPALEQASGYEVSTYRAGRFKPFGRLVDLGCSIGGDTLALAVQAPTLGLDLDPLRLSMARTNLAALNMAQAARFIRADLRAALPLAPNSTTGVFFDPARRSGGQRVFSVRNYLPPLSIIESWLPRFPALSVKISPGVKLEELAAYDAELEFISLRGELKEAVLWFGPLKTARRRATLLPGPATLVGETVSSSPTDRRLPLSEPQAFLYEPDPAVLRAGLVQDLGLQLGAAQLDPDIAYLTAGQLTFTPFAHAYSVEAWLPFSLKRLRAALRERGVGHVVVKKRGSPLQPEALIKDLRLSGDQERTVFLTHLAGKPVAILSTGRVSAAG
ncbi:MAG TPA: class I SAM-dependent methyltransferase [Anaerolineales bacterium]